MWVPRQEDRIQQSNNNKLLIIKRSNQSFQIPKNGRWGICDANGMFQWTGSCYFGGEEKGEEEAETVVAVQIWLLHQGQCLLDEWYLLSQKWGKEGDFMDSIPCKYLNYL